MSYRKTDIFKTELSWIKSDKIRDYFTKAVNLLPDYFFEIPASSTGKYHPEYATGSGGLVRHTKAFAGILRDLVELEYLNFTQDEKDIMLGASLVHDGCKSGLPKSEFSIADHPLVVVNMLKTAPELKDLLTPEQEDVCYRVISSHMGQWNTDYRTKQEILPKPKTKDEFIVHLADYLASRKYLAYQFDEWYDPKNYFTNELGDTIKSIITFCKEAIASGTDRELLYKIIEENSGNRNPNAIKDMDTAKKVADALVTATTQKGV